MASEAGFAPGTYSYPIVFQMPVGVPGTYTHYVWGTNATLQYNLYCELYTDTEGVGRAWSPIIVMQGLRKQAQVGLQGGSSAEMVGCCSCGNSRKDQHEC